MIGLISTWHDDLQHNPHKISLCPKILSFDSAVSSPVKRFPSLKLKSQVLRSPSLSSSQLYGKNLVFRECSCMPGRGKSFSPSSSSAQQAEKEVLHRTHRERWRFMIRTMMDMFLFPSMNRPAGFTLQLPASS